MSGMKHVRRCIMIAAFLLFLLILLLIPHMHEPLTRTPPPTTPRTGTGTRPSSSYACHRAVASSMVSTRAQQKRHANASSSSSSAPPVAAGPTSRWSALSYELQRRSVVI